MNKKLVLASQSPRRRELVQYLGVPFNVVSPQCDEVLKSGLSVEKQIEELALRKAKSVLPAFNDSIVLGSDTVIVLDGSVLGKPKDEADARAMLRRLSGRSHNVITAVALVSSNVEHVFSVNSTVTFYDISEREIEAYVASKEPLDKAGSYSVQGHAALYVKHVDGDFYAVMGLPVSRVYQELKQRTW